MNAQELAARAQNIIAGRRQRAVMEAQRTRAALEQQEPQLLPLEQKRTLAGLQAARLAATGAPRAEVDAALADVAAAEAQVRALLEQRGLGADALEPKYTCPLCGDTGQTADGICSCMQTLMREMRGSEVNMSSPLDCCTFARFDAARYPNVRVPELGITAREQMEQVLAYCKNYAAHFTAHADSLYFYGNAGLGKTHLALAIANEVLNKGFDVVYVSAQEAFANIEEEHFGRRDGDTLDTLLGADLLILDDLGTEYISAYISACLYNVVNTRGLRRVPTIYTTNLMRGTDLARRYTEKLASRLLGTCQVLSFCGEDLRLQGK